MATTDYLDERIRANAHVYIAGEEVQFVTMELEQELAQHHSFSIVIDYQRMQGHFMDDPLKQMKLIGKFVDIDLQQGGDSGNAYEFRGLIENVSFKGEKGKNGYLIVKGRSTTALLERGKRMDIFTAMDLGRVFEEVTDGIINKKLSVYNKPVSNNPVTFLMQYYESDWEFLQRLSAITGETLMYTGRDLVFGQYPDWATQTVTYDKEIIEFEFGSRLLANNYSRYQYLPEQDDTIEQEAPSRIENSNDYINSAADRSKELTEKRPVNTPIGFQIADKGSLDELVTREKTATAASTVYVTGKSKTCAPRIGRLLTITMPSTMPEASALGTFRIVKVKHMISESGYYECYFEGIPAGLKFFPTTELKMPTADSVRATVIRNDDPLGQGRVRVKFPFALDRPSETWLRVMTPNAGSCKDVSHNRGMVFVPEVDDSVMIGFEFGDPNRPYILGSLFHGKNGKGGGSNNAEKSIITRSGIKIVFNDDQKSLHIEDPSGNTWDMDGHGNIGISAVDNMYLKGKNIELNASNNLSLITGNNLFMKVANQLASTASHLKNTVTNSIQFFSRSSQIVSTDTIAIQSNILTAVGSNKLTIESKELIEANSLKSIAFHSSESMNMTQQAEESEPIEPIKITLATVDFRPLKGSAYKGEYGFDWLRVKEPDADELPYKDLLIGGYKSDTEDYSAQVAFDKMAGLKKFKGEYEKIVIQPRNTEIIPVEKRDETNYYYVPYMSLYSEESCKGYSFYKPEYSAKLRILLDVYEDLDRIEFEDNTNFEFSPKVISEEISACLKDVYMEVTITCKKDIETEGDGSIYVIYSIS